jgi:hypothetical protein
VPLGFRHSARVPVDENAHVETACCRRLISEVIIPLLSMQSSCLLCISTLLQSSNHYSKMMTMKDFTGADLFENISITLVCDECLKTAHPEKCRHKQAEMPRWLSSKKMEVVRSLLADDPAMLLRESMGVSADSSNSAFPSDDVLALFERPTYVFEDEMMDEDPRCVLPRVDSQARKRTPSSQIPTTRRAKYIVVAVDPSGGGGSAFAMASVVQLPSGTIVVRAGSPSTKQFFPVPHVVKHCTQHDKSSRGLCPVF